MHRPHLSKLNPFMLQKPQLAIFSLINLFCLSGFLRTLCLFCLFGFFGLFCFSASADEAFDAQLKRAEELINKGKHHAAEISLKEILKTHPNDASAHAQLGAALAGQVDDDKYDAAIEQELTALKLDPKSWSARKILGMIYANQKKQAEAIKLFNEAAAIKPDSFSIQKDLGIAYASIGKTDEAISAFNKALKLKPQNVEACLRLSAIYAASGDIKNGISTAKRAIEIAPKKAETHLALANLLLSEKDYAEAIKAYDAAIAENGYDSLGCLNPLTAANAWSGRGLAKAETDPKLVDEAIKDQKRAIKFYPSFPLAYKRLAQLNKKAGYMKAALAAYPSALSAAPTDLDLAVEYAQVLSANNKKSEAKRLLESLLKAHPGFEPATKELSKLQTK